MKKLGYSIFLVLALSLMAMPADAQKAKKKTVRKAVVVAKPKVDPVVEALKEKMMEAVQRVVVFDSVVVDKAQFLDAYKLCSDIATIGDYDKVFASEDHPNSFAFTNGLKTKSYFALADSAGNTILYSSDFFDNQWSEAQPVDGIDTKETFLKANYPFMMTDGQTFYFAAQGSESLGGYDIFFTRYDADTKSFLQPENIGMPFNSTANDYMLVIDDINQIGWFASDRNQPEGKVCIYMFVPSTVRDNYDSSEIDEEKLESLAQLNSIADTWAVNPHSKTDALARYAGMKSPSVDDESSSDGAMHLVINDNKVYTNTKQFVVKANIERYYQLSAMTNKYEKLALQLDNLRKQFADSPNRDLQTAIIASERNGDSLRNEIADMETLIVNTENKALKNN